MDDTDFPDILNGKEQKDESYCCAKRVRFIFPSSVQLERESSREILRAALRPGGDRGAQLIIQPKAFEYDTKVSDH